jgi:hypothetical protein
MSRTAVKQALKTVLQSVTGIKTVYTNLPRQQPPNAFPSVVITMEKAHEEAVTKGDPGRRWIHYTVTLYIQSIDANPDEIASQQAFEDLLDAIDTALRANKQLTGYTGDGQMLMSAWKYIDTDIFQPQIAGNGQAVTMRAIKTFDVVVEIIG